MYLEERTVRFDIEIQYEGYLRLPTPTQNEMAGMLEAIMAAYEWLPLRAPIVGASSAMQLPQLPKMLR